MSLPNLRKIPGYPCYLAGDDGHIYSTKGKVLRRMKGSYNHVGYQQVVLAVDSKSICRFVHRLIALAWVPNPDNKPQVNHLNSVRDDNIPANLEWVTCGENHLHAYATNGRLAPNSGKPSSQHTRARPVIGTHLKTGEQLKFGCIEDTKHQGFTPQGVFSALKGLQTHHKGYSWSYISQR